MKESPTVSIACITYNQKNFVVELIESILSQTYDDWELLIGDDASTDGTQEILRTYEIQYPDKIYVAYNPQNLGITNNFQNVLNRCQGKYVAWVGGDDMFLPDQLKYQVELMDAHPEVALCYHNSDVFDSITGKTLFLYYDVNPIPKGGVGSIIECGGFCGSSVMTRRSCHPPKGHDPRIPIAADWLFWIQTCDKGEIAYIDKVLSRYRIHSHNATKTRYDIDKFTTLGIVLKERPDLLPSIKKVKASILSNMGIRQFEDRNPLPARYLLEYSLRHRLNCLTIAFFLLSMLGNRGIQIMEIYRYIKKGLGLRKQ